jgi:outer membrane protein OmpA-like peptidoglycan-associated protein
MINVQSKGTVANKGCPEVSPEVIKQLNEYGKTILFDSGKSSFKSFSVLESITSILKEYLTQNLKGILIVMVVMLKSNLSENRAAVRNYLVEKVVID